MLIFYVTWFQSTCRANDICKESKRQIINADDVFKALEETEYSEFIRPLKASLEGESTYWFPDSNYVDELISCAIWYLIAHHFQIVLMSYSMHWSLNPVYMFLEVHSCCIVNLVDRYGISLRLGKINFTKLFLQISDNNGGFFCWNLGSSFEVIWLQMSSSYVCRPD